MEPLQSVAKARRATRRLTVAAWSWLASAVLLMAINQVFGLPALNLIGAATFFVCGFGLATVLWSRDELRQDRQWLVTVNEGEHAYVVTARNAMVANEIAASAYQERCSTGARYRTATVNLDTAMRKWDHDKLKRTLDGAQVIPDWWTR